MNYLNFDSKSEIINIKKREIPLTNLKSFNYNLLTGLKSEKTLKDYFFYLKNFLKYIYKIENADISEENIVSMLYNINKEDISNYIIHLKNEKDLKNNSINKIISALKHFFIEIESRDINFINPIKNIKYLKKDHKDLEKITRLTKEDIKIMIESVELNTEKDLRNKLIMKTLYYTGMRSDELRSVTFNQIIKKEENYIIKLFKTKSQQIQYIPLHQELAKEILEYKKQIKYTFNINEEQIENNLIFPAFFEKNTKLTANSLNFMLKNIANRTILKEISAHQFRHAIATELLLADNNVGISEVQDFLRHADIKTTKIYDDAIELKKQTTVNKIPTL